MSKKYDELRNRMTSEARARSKKRAAELLALTETVVSPCHRTKLFVSLGDILIGSCSACNANIARINRNTGRAERLDGNSPWTDRDLRPINP